MPAPKVSDLERVDCILSMVENMLKRRFIECENGEQLKRHETLVHFEGQCYATPCASHLAKKANRKICQENTDGGTAFPQ